jgi:hypothetical protein
MVYLRNRRYLCYLWFRIIRSSSFLRGNECPTLVIRSVDPHPDAGSRRLHHRDKSPHHDTRSRQGAIFATQYPNSFCEGKAPLSGSFLIVPPRERMPYTGDLLYGSPLVAWSLGPYTGATSPCPGRHLAGGRPNRWIVLQIPRPDPTGRSPNDRSHRG